jgi:DNA-binding MarR family transcriptional regulator
MLKSTTEVEGRAGEDGLAVLIVRAGHGAMRVVDAELAPFGLSLTQYLMLSRLAELLDAGTATPGVLARSCCMDSGATTRLLDRLESMRMLERRPEPKDRRTIRLSLTEHGRSMLPELGAAVERAHAAMLRNFPPHDVERFRACLDAVIGHAMPHQEAS